MSASHTKNILISLVLGYVYLTTQILLDKNLEEVDIVTELIISWKELIHPADIVVFYHQIEMGLIIEDIIIVYSKEDHEKKVLFNCGCLHFIKY
jgi:hypothetical protein